MSSSVVYPAENRHKKRPICRVEQISLVISCKTRGASSPVCWLCRAAERSAPTTPLLRFILAYAQPKVNMRAKLLPYANRKADTETAAQAVRCARTAQAVHPVRAGSFAVNHSGELPLRAAGAQEGRQPAVFHPLVNLPFSLLPWVQTVDCVSVEKRERQRIFSQRSHIGNLRQTLQGKGVIHKRVETAGVYPLMLPRRVPQSPAVPQRTLRPETTNRSHGSGTPESLCREIFARKAHADQLS